MAEQRERHAGVGGRGAVDDVVEVGEVVAEVLDQRPLALGLAVAEVVEPVDGGAVRDQGLGDVLVAPDVLAVAVREDHHPARVLERPVGERDRPARAGERVRGACGRHGRGSCPTEGVDADTQEGWAGGPGGRTIVLSPPPPAPEAPVHHFHAEIARQVTESRIAGAERARSTRGLARSPRAARGPRRTPRPVAHRRPALARLWRPE